MIESPETVTPSETPLLFTPIRMGRRMLKNRIIVSPMGMYSAVDGFVDDFHLVHLGARALGGAAVVMLEATAVEERGRITTGCTGIWKDEHIGPLKRITEFIKRQDSLPGIQLSHAGRKGSTVPPWISYAAALPESEGGWQTVAPSAIAYGGGIETVPSEATLEDIAGFKKSFVDGALRSVEAGFELIELHFAHGYLLQTFLSPFSNKRTDQYGGNFENRIRLAMEIITDVKCALPEDFPLFVRISCSDNLPDGQGWELSDSIELARRFKAAGVHLVDCSSGLNAYYGKNFFMTRDAVNQIEMAAVIQRESGLATGALGGIVNPEWAESILRDGKATLVFIGRVALYEPHWPLHAACHFNVENHTGPVQYQWAFAGTRGHWRDTTLTDYNATELKQRNKS